MNNKSDIRLIRTLFSRFPNELFLCHRVINHLRTNENLSASGLLCLKTLEQCHHHMKHLCGLIDFATDGRKVSETFSPESYDSEQLISEITETFLNTVAGYLPVKATHCSKLSAPFPVYVNKNLFESIFLNLLYCCVKTIDAHNTKELKLTLSVKDTKQNICFHIHSGSAGRDPKLLAKLFSDDITETAFTEDVDEILVLSAKIAKHFVHQSNGKLTYTPLKNGCRYNISLPKAPKSATNRLCAPKTYIPSKKQFEETFAEFILASLLESDVPGGLKK